MSDIRDRVLNQLQDIEVLVRLLGSDAYQGSPEPELATPMLAELINQKLYQACELLSPSQE